MIQIYITVKKVCHNCGCTKILANYYLYVKPNTYKTGVLYPITYDLCCSKCKGIAWTYFVVD